MRQTAPSLKAPPAQASDLASFPVFSLTSGIPLFRVGRRGKSPWWFGSSGAGRFDLAAPDGTCYLAGDPVAALLEVIGPDREGGFVSSEFFAERLLFRLRVPSAQRLADAAASGAAAFGVTLEIHTLVPYDLPQAWAARFRQAGLDGVRYLLRHDPAGEEGFALFGPAGVNARWPGGKEQPIGPDLLEELRAASGIEILSIPHSSQLDLA